MKHDIFLNFKFFAFLILKLVRSLCSSVNFHTIIVCIISFYWDGLDYSNKKNRTRWEFFLKIEKIKFDKMCDLFLLNYDDDCELIGCYITIKIDAENRF